MAQSLSKVYIHVVFSTKHRKRLLNKQINAELKAYIIGCLSNIKSYTYEIFINPDHIHILCTLPRTITQATLISKIKTPSSKWLKEKGIPNFRWQDGYGIFSVSSSAIGAVKTYIQIQNQHHHKRTFKEELRLFFEKYEIEYDERYVWD